jgi:putative PEP-CTERM system TPR-repeat lipoprotein
MMNLAMLDSRENKPAAAKARYRDILKSDGKHLGALMALAGIAYSENAVDESVDLMRKAAEANPTALQPRQRLIDHYLRSRDNPRALNVARDFVRQNPRNAAAVELLGRTEIAVGETSSAVETFRSLTQIVNDPLQAQRMVAGAQIAAKDMISARATYRDMLRVNSKYLPGYLGLIDVETREGKFDEAIRVAQEAAIVAPDQPVTDVLSGDIYLKAQRYDDAAKSFQAALTKAPSTDLALRVFNAQRAAGKVDAAYQGLTGWVAKNGNDRRAHHLLASTYLNDDKLDDALREYERLLAAEPKNVGVLNNLAWIYQQKQNPKAATLAAEAYQLAPEVAAVADTYGWILVRGGQTAQGLELLQKAQKLSPQDPEVSYHLAYALNANGKKDEARRLLQGLLQDGKTFKYLNDAKTLLQQLGG